MLHILLLILKIIGIVLLSVIGLVLLIIALVLFVPVRYRLKVTADGKMQGNVCVSWLLHIVHVKVSYKDGIAGKLRIFGIPLKKFPDPGPEEDSQKGKKEKKKKKGKVCEISEDNGTVRISSAPEGAQAARAQDAPNEAFPKGKEENAEPDAERLTELWDAEESDADDLGKRDEEDENAGEKQKPKGIFRKIGAFFRKLFSFFKMILSFFGKIRYTIRGICDKIKGITHKIGDYLDMIQSPEGVRTIALLKKALGSLLKHICPTKFRGRLKIGKEDPAEAGKIAAIAGMLYPLTGSRVNIEAVFGKKCLEGDLFVKGRIRVITLIRIAWRVYFNKDLKKIRRKLKS